MDPKRIIAIGDIHGCLRALDTLLDAVQLGPQDRVITLGDYIDRGPDSRGVIDRLIQLSLTVPLTPLLGNHEEMLLSVVDGEARPQLWLPHGGVATLDSYGFTDSLDCIPQSHISFMRNCVTWVELDRHFFVHANYDPGLPLDEQSPYKLRWESLVARMPGPHQSGKIAVVGHTPDRNGEILDVGYLKCIDTYCYGGKWLTAVDLLTGQSWQANQQGQLRDP
ncbi:MAG: metallophosphoesterase family protein [Pirellulales bacterium]